MIIPTAYDRVIGRELIEGGEAPEALRAPAPAPYVVTRDDHVRWPRWSCLRADVTCALVAAIFNLNHPAHTIHWHFIELSVSNVIVIVLMLIVFAAAILLPFPHHEESEELP